MFFGSEASILPPGNLPTEGDKMVVTMWPITNTPLKSSLRSLNLEQLKDEVFLRSISVLVMFSRIKEEEYDQQEDESAEFTEKMFSSTFKMEGFERSVTITDDYGFYYILHGEESPILARSRAISFAQVIRARPIEIPSISPLLPPFDLFRDLSRLSLRFPIVPPPHSLTSFLPNSKSIDFITPNSSQNPTLKWGKEEKISRWKNDVTEIVDFIYVSSGYVAGNAELMQKRGIKNVINVAAQVMKTAEGFNTLAIPMFDGGDENILSYIWMTSSFIEDSLERGEPVLVHCAEGVSRSVSVVIGYLILSRDMPYDQAFKLVRSRRRIASPNPIFIAQLLQLSEIVGAKSSKTCFFSKNQKVPFEFKVYRNRFVPRPVAAEVADTKTYVMVDYTGMEDLHKESDEGGAVLIVNKPNELEDEDAEVLESFIKDLTRWLRIGTIKDNQTGEKKHVSENDIPEEEEHW